MGHLVNDVDHAVQDSIDGLVRASGGRLARLDGYPDIKVVVRTDAPRDRVAVVSGGGAGHEPAHAGFVGQGLLTAAVCGDIFASPSVDAVLAAIVSVTGDAGCLVIVKNYTGDRLNFGLAVERARALGLAVEMVVVGDDIALPDAPQPRGLAGTLFVHKTAGAAAESGASLAEVAAVAGRVASTAKTLGVSLTGVAIPGRPYTERVEPGTAELGLGIHGEPGAHTIQLEDAAALVASMASSLEESVSGGPLALLLNNLGGVAALELGIVLRDLLATPLGARASLLTGPALLMTSLAAQGFSVSALPVDAELTALLQAPVAAHIAWPGALPVGEVTLVEVPAVENPTFTASADHDVRTLLTAVCDSIIEAEGMLNTLDSYVGDGDTGSTFSTAARRVLAGLDTLPLAERPALFSALSGILATSMGGSSGVLGSVFFAAAGTASAQGVSVADALQAGIGAMQRYGGASVGDRTMLDALVPAVAALSTGSAADAAEAAEKGSTATASMTSARAGRSAYVPSEHLADVQDPGAAAIAVMFRAAATTTPPA
ncbi:dihydroxyacetone kinase subunit DhaK [Kineosporia sp. NBRC 101731]|uniref:dihydroxyacetone kinase subunit DhaK n=1 Tax=Kineosporia sp. NBRC 101731 TaxID=3032199 RepID=UPI0024A30A8D|nr:dihydroxyacetone kinase subunit DhaK [Kineosporia sp. NBRC 101731]GLY33356.1 dihydroxyacetone kinase [Kineosporia sp. NBRC 101731]